MQRKEIILKSINRNGVGLEIGPSHNPVAPKSDGFNVEILDHLNKEDLIQKYQLHDVNTDNIEAVDYIWNGESYNELTGKTNYYDWIIASHVIEHTPDFIGFINECEAILKDDGVLSLAVPDKRYCFDYFRPLTGISKIIDSHLLKYSMHSIGSIIDYKLNVVSKSGQIAWDSNSIGNDFNFLFGADHASNYLIKNGTRTYTDVHAWCFTPNSFRLLIQDLNTLNLISLKEIDFYPTQGCEFFITLGKSGAQPEKSRLEMLSLINDEIKEGIDYKKVKSNTEKESWLKRNLRRLKKLIT